MKTIKMISLLASITLLVACGQESIDVSTDLSSDGSADVADDSASVAPVEAGPAVVEIVPGLTMRILQEGTGAVAEDGQDVTVHYTGWLHDETAVDARGDKFDSSVDRGKPFEFILGAGRVIKGWDQGVVGMKIGEIRELTIAPEMAYGNRAVGNLIAPDSTLVFEVELMGLSGDDEEETE